MSKTPKTYKVTFTEGDCEPQVFVVEAFDYEHAVEVAWDRAGGPEGDISENAGVEVVQQITFKKRLH